MGRVNRLHISQEEGSYHIISRTAGQNFLLDSEAKDYFVGILERFCQGFFVSLHSFCVMDNHFHLLVTMLEKEAKEASDQELFYRYKLLYGLDYEMMENLSLKGSGSYRRRHSKVEKLRLRLCDISKFVQELKQTFSRWYNRIHKRTGYLWSDRYNGFLISKGRSQVQVSAYIDLNALRAKIVEKPDDYEWCSFFHERNHPKSVWINRITTVEMENDFSEEDYLCYVYEQGGISHLLKETQKKPSLAV